MLQLKPQRRSLRRTAPALAALILCFAAFIAVTQASSDESATSPASKRADSPGDPKVAIQIPPPFWRTWPFYILVAALVVGLGLAIYRLRLAKMRANRRGEAKMEEHSHEASEARRRIVEITDSVPGVVFEFEKMRDGTARAPFVSGGMEALIGVSAADVMEDVSRYFAAVLPEDVEAYVADIDRSAATRSDHRYTVRVRHALSGEIRWLYVDAPAPQVDGEGTARWRGYLQDVTNQKRLEDARRRAEQELQRQAEEFNTLANSIAQLAWMTDATGSIVWYNQRWYDFTGTTLEEMQGWGWQKVHHPDEVGRVVKSIQHAFATGEPWEDTFPLRSKEGEYRWFLSRALPIRDAEGRVVRWFGTNTDVTEQRQMEQALQRQAEELKRINFLSDIALELTGCGYWHVDYSDPDHYYQSERAANILGEPIKPDGRYHLQNEWFARLIEADPEVAKQTAERYQGAIEGRYQNYQATYAYKRPADGNVVWVHALGKVVRAENGHISYMYGVYQDITQRIKDEAALRDAMEKLESATKAKSRQLEQSQRQAEELNRINILADSALDLANAGHWHLPLDNSDCYRPSERAARILGELPNPDHRYRLDEWAEHVRAGDEAIAKLTAENFAAAIAGTIPMYDATYLYKRPIDGRLVWIHAMGHVVKDAAGKPTDMYGVIQDITDFKRLESDLRLALQKSDDATKAKSAFLANMSHEIRTPMNGIMGMTELALDTELTGEQRDYLVTVKSSADALLSLINDILDFSKIEAGRIELEPIEFLLRDSIGDTLSPLALRAAAKGVELAYDVHPDVPDALIGDVYRLRQIIVNLAGNAIKFTERGEVVIAVNRKDRHGDDVVIEVVVRDTGIGIAPQAAARLFKAFEQAESSTTRKYGGTGLGLAISKQLVELMGGQIRLESTPGVGSAFIFTVQLKVGVARASATPDDAAQALAGKVALIIDDNETNRRIVGKMLDQWGLQVITADSAKSALTLLDRAGNAGHPISLIITDLHMPEMDGFDFISAVRAHPRFGSTTIMLLTSSASPGDQARCNELGVAARLLKPVKQSLLLDNIMRVLGAHDLLKPVTPDKSSLEAESGEAVRPLKVLLAEDNAVNQKFAIKVLKGAGHSVVVANNGREAVEKSASESFDIVLMDVQMPEMDGLDATRVIRAREAAEGTGGKRSRVPIIAMTANAMKGDREMCIAAGMDGYVAKPVKRELLFAEVSRVLKGGGHGAAN